ncbi:CLUMA_CG011630, isoform A [Clunio marinus]|uniref:CLUMA_CG011630, isoform A n=1 Tax=Clunio marinus TaxID=568069 RepID=A0A1J1IFE0_9DIPT|nr:CLUMA_CG011630, isoform A [Clunio marinus]
MKCDNAIGIEARNASIEITYVDNVLCYLKDICMKVMEKIDKVVFESNVDITFRERFKQFVMCE